MKKGLLSLLGVATLFAWSCQSDDLTTAELDNAISAPGGNGKGNAYGLVRNCSSDDVLQRQLKDNPGRAQKLAQIESFTQRFIEAKKPDGTGGGKPGGGSGGGGGSTPTPYEGTVTIPVVVHVLYNTSEQNISDAQVASQIDVLNTDFNATNSAELNGIPAEFAGAIGNANIQFTLAQTIRKQSSKTSWGTNDAMKYSSQGGSDAVDPANNLNIWVCNIGGGILGYAQFPGGDPTSDGVVISPQFFGTTGYVQAPFNKGRTGTHEVGHYLNLRHIWGDGRCRQDDYVADTPSSDRSNYGCPSYPTVHCKSADMTMNYMDYTDDACMYMFSQGQVDRMRALFASGGVRESFVL